MLRGSRSSSNTEDPVAVNPGIQGNTSRYVRLEGLYTSSSLQPYFSKEPSMRSGIEIQDKIGESKSEQLWQTHVRKYYPWFFLAIKHTLWYNLQ